MITITFGADDRVPIKSSVGQAQGAETRRGGQSDYILLGGSVPLSQQSQQGVPLAT